MYELTVETEFCAAHTLLIAGQREVVHGHNWHVIVTIAGDTLDADGLLCDFHAVESTLAEVIRPLNNADLNSSPAFRSINPSAEHVVRYIADTLRQRLTLPAAARIAAVRVIEAPGCAATYRPT